MLISLLYFLSLVSYKYLQPQCLVEAIARTNEGFSVNLIHRHSSPKSPYYNASLSPIEVFHRLTSSSASRHRYIQWKLNNFEVVTSDLTPNEGDYLMEIEVGTPPVELLAVVDTGTDLTWFQSKPCTVCYQQNTTIFDPESSTTYNEIPCITPYCSNFDATYIDCDQQENVCRYTYSYGNVTTLSEGVMGNDTISFTKGCLEPVSFPSIYFGCGYQQYGVFDTDSAGVVGLGYGPLSLVSQLGPSVSGKFSYCLTFVTSPSASKLTFGGFVDDSLVNGLLTTPLVDTYYPSSFYNLGLRGISVGLMTMNMDKEIIIDTGTTLTYLEPSIYYNLEAMVNDAIGANPVSDNALVEPVLCYDTTTAVLTPPDIVLHLVGGDLVLKANNIFFATDNYLCLSITKSSKDGDAMVLGNMAQVNLDIEFDLISKTVSFAPRDCSQEISAK